MSIEFDPETGKMFYQGREIGEHQFKNGKSTVRLNIEYVTTADDWIVPLILLSQGLSKLPENLPPPPLLSLETPEDGIDAEYDVARFLTEKQVKRGNYVWNFHKTDADPWPSRLHGHDYEKGLKLDAITGDIYDVGTRRRCKSLKSIILGEIQTELRSSKDFVDLVRELIDNP